MAAILVTCDAQCGDLQVAPGQVEVRMSSVLGWAQYTLRCPKCDAVTTKNLNIDKVKLLRGVGVRVHEVAVPAEVAERGTSDLPALDRNYILDFALALDKVNTVAEMLPDTTHPGN